ncbi:5-aminolevulinate synthase [Whalleya microplaca]|nr:5-aminolevulinate synthase [Whalleya microplaca]
MVALREDSDSEIKLPSEDLAIRVKDHQLHPEATKALPTFYRNLEEALNVRRSGQNLYSVVTSTIHTHGAIDFCSGDVLSLGTSGAQRAEFLAELARHPDFTPGSGGARLMDGNYSYLEQTERAIAQFHGAERGLILGSGYEANGAIWTAIPRPGDVILYDEMVHASTHEGMRNSLAIRQFPFPHNDIEAFRNSLAEILDSQPLIKQGKRSVIVAVEAIYSMDGDICPLQGLLDAAKEVFVDGQSVQFVVDEAHSVGVIGPSGAGLVCELGLQSEIAIVMHAFGKAMAATGAVILCNDTARAALVNFAKSFIFSTAPALPFVAAIKSAYNLVVNKPAQEARERVQNLVRLFYQEVASHPLWPVAERKGLLYLPQMDGWEDRSIHTQIIMIHTRDRYTWWLYYQLLSSSCCVYPVHHPIVPLGRSRIRAIVHSNNTEEHIQKLTDTIFHWVEEVMDIEEGRVTQKAPGAARIVYEWMEKEGLSGFGLVRD